MKIPQPKLKPDKIDDLIALAIHKAGLQAQVRVLSQDISDVSSGYYTVGQVDIIDSLLDDLGIVKEYEFIEDEFADWVWEQEQNHPNMTVKQIVEPYTTKDWYSLILPWLEKYRRCCEKTN